MPLFRYKAKTINGEILNDVIEADNHKLVAEYIQQQGHFPLSITPEEKNKVEKLSFQTKITKSNLLVFTSQICDLLKGGLPLAKAIALAGKQTENTKLREIIKDISQQLHKGSSFSQSLAKYPELFNSLYIGLVEAGESGGMLEISMERIAHYQEKEQDLLNKIKTALAYPLAMLAIGLSTVVFLLVFVIPKFSLIFQDVEKILPLPTRILIWTSALLKNGWWYYLPVIIIGGVWLTRYINTPKGRQQFDLVKLKIPLLGKVVQQEMVIRFTRTLGVLLLNGVPLINALETVKKAVGNTVISAEIDRLYEEIKVGQGLVAPLSKSTVFPPVIADLVAAGQEVGSLENALLKIADTYETKVENAVKALTSLLEPIVILFMGLVVGFVVLAMLLPIFEISGAIK